MMTLTYFDPHIMKMNKLIFNSVFDAQEDINNKSIIIILLPYPLKAVDLNNLD